MCRPRRARSGLSSYRARGHTLLYAPLVSQHSFGIDFGTTNTSIAFARPDGGIALGLFPFFGELTDTYRSLLYFEQVARKNTPPQTFCWTGPSGIEHYLSAETQGRLIQSLKSFLAVRNMEGTQVFERQRTIEELVGRILADVRHAASRQFGIDIRHATVGRPVRFVGADTREDDNYAEDRLADAFSLAGFDTIAFELEPVAAAHEYENSLDHDELILIGDFGGGTSDFSLVRVGPTVREQGRTEQDLLGNAGVTVAGDAFDAKIAPPRLAGARLVEPVSIDGQAAADADVAVLEPRALASSVVPQDRRGHRAARAPQGPGAGT